MRKLILSLFMLCLCIISNAQFSVAFVAGPQMNSVTPAFSLNPDTNSVYTVSKHTGLNLGFIANSVLNKKQTFFFRTGVLYSARGSQVFQQFDTSLVDLTTNKCLFQATTNLKLNYIDIPVNLLYKFPIKRNTKFFLGGGIQASTFYSGSTELNTVKAFKEDPDSLAELEYKQAVNKDLLVGSGTDRYKTIFFSGNALAGFEFGKVFLTVNYSNGLTNFFKSDNESYKHNTLGFHFGISLGSTQYANKVVSIKDRDKDGITDDVDGCPDEAGTAFTNGCPDKDGDGIADKNDRCPDLAGTLQNIGCPVLDKDSDGVVDEKDHCPDVFGLPKYNGCPVPDSDLDGINDEEDQCPTVAGDKDNHGCPGVTKEQQQKIEYAAKRIQFEFKKADLLSSSFVVLDEVIEILKLNPTLKIKVEGHSSGPESESNKILSQKRADRVKDYFITHGIAIGRILAQGFGSSRHISKDGDKKENSEDRRVELITF